MIRWYYIILFASIGFVVNFCLHFCFEHWKLFAFCWLCAALMLKHAANKKTVHISFIAHYHCTMQWYSFLRRESGGKKSRNWKFIETILFEFRCHLERNAKMYNKLIAKNITIKYTQFTMHAIHMYISCHTHIFPENILLCISRWGLLSFVLDIDAAKSVLFW